MVCMVVCIVSLWVSVWLRGDSVGSWELGSEGGREWDGGGGCIVIVGGDARCSGSGNEGGEELTRGCMCMCGGGSGGGWRVVRFGLRGGWEGGGVDVDEW